VNFVDYEGYAQTLKALANAKRLEIVDLLSCGTLCACDILAHFSFTQPTLSHHMKVLQDAGIVRAEKRGRWQYYTLVAAFTTEFPQFAQRLLQRDENCICHEKTQAGSDCEEVG
jgi:ArsR family transcriptional regulator